MSHPAIAVPATRSTKPQWRTWLSLENRYVPPVFITLILLIGHLTYGILESYPKTLLAIGTSIVTELILGRIFTGKFPNLASAYITGISVGILIRSPGFWPYGLCAAIAITSKYVIRFHGRHLFNPSNFGICVMLFLSSESVAMLSIQWGNNVWPMVIIWTLGSAILWRARRLQISATYVVSFFVLAFVRAWITHDPWQSEIAPITGPEYQLFIFFMITDPKTTLRSKTGQCSVAFLVAVAELFLRLEQSVYAPLYALFLVGPPALLIETWLNARGGRVTGSALPISLSEQSTAARS
jgi:enediyne biosynthesis protein E5